MDDKVMELLLKLLEDMSYVKAKLDNIDKQNFSVKIEALEAESQKQKKQLSALEHRSNELEKFIRENFTNDSRTKTSIFISIGICVLTAVITFIFNLL